jgi:hypothetical protein
LFFRYLDNYIFANANRLFRKENSYKLMPVNNKYRKIISNPGGTVLHLFKGGVRGGKKREETPACYLSVLKRAMCQVTPMAIDESISHKYQ